MAVQLPLSHPQFGRKGISEEGGGKRREGKNREEKEKGGNKIMEHSDARIKS